MPDNGGILPTWARWNYSPAMSNADEETGMPPPRGTHLDFSKRSRFLDSKIVWRFLIALVALLLLANLFRPAPIIDRVQRIKQVIGQVPETSPQRETPHVPVHHDVHDQNTTDWSQYAYCQYVTNEQYLCNSMMIFDSLVKMGAKADLLMMYPESWQVGSSDFVGRLLAKARDEYKAHLMPITVQTLVGEQTWMDSFTKLLAFNQTQYKRVLSLDSDATVLQLFLLPSAPVAMPRAYWLSNADHDRDYLSSQVLLVQPSASEFQRILGAFESRGTEDFDMEIVNKLYGDSCMVLPHRPYDLLTGEFKSTDHHKYLGSTEEAWDPDKAFKEAKFLHFSDWPLPKPWEWNPEYAASDDVRQNQPKCQGSTWGKKDCRQRDLWLSFYTDFMHRRKEVCGSELTYQKRSEEPTLLNHRPRSQFEPIFH